MCSVHPDFFLQGGEREVVHESADITEGWSTRKGQPIEKAVDPDEVGGGHVGRFGYDHEV